MKPCDILSLIDHATASYTSGILPLFLLDTRSDSVYTVE